MGPTIDQGRLRAPHGVRAVVRWRDLGARDPAFHDPGVLACGQVSQRSLPSWEQVVLSGQAPSVDPMHDGAWSLFGELKLDRSTCLALNDLSSCPKATLSGQIANPKGNEVASAKLAVDRQVEQSQTRLETDGERLATTGAIVTAMAR